MHAIKYKLSSPLGILFVTILVDFLGFGILIPVIPSLFANAASPSYLLPIGTSTESGYLLMGFILALYFVGQFFMSPILGELSDRYGRKPLLFISVSGSAFAFALFGLGIGIKSVVIVFIARGINAVTSSIVAVSQAAIADITSPAERTKNFGLIGAAFGIGFVLGPFIGGTLSNANLVSWFGPATPFWFACVLSLGNAYFVLRYFRETNMHLVHRPLTIARSLGNIRRAFHMKEVRTLFATNFFYQAGFTFYMTFFSVFLITRYGFSQQAIGNYFAYVGLWIVISQGFLLRRVPHRITSEQILRVSIIGTSIFLMFQYFTGAWWELFFIVPFLAIANGFSVTNMPSLISRTASASGQGEILGLNASVESLARTMPPLISGAIAGALAPSSPLIISSLLIACAWGIFVLFSNRTTSTVH